MTQPGSKGRGKSRGKTHDREHDVRVANKSSGGKEKGKGKDKDKTSGFHQEPKGKGKYQYHEVKGKSKNKASFAPLLRSSDEGMVSFDGYLADMMQSIGIEQWQWQISRQTWHSQNEATGIGPETSGVSKRHNKKQNENGNGLGISKISNKLHWTKWDEGSYLETTKYLKSTKYSLDQAGSESVIQALPLQPDIYYYSHLRSPTQPVKYGEPLNLLKETFIKKNELHRIFRMLENDDNFRYFAGRSVLDFKINGRPAFAFSPPYQLFNPLVNAMTAMAWKSLRHDEELAVIQILVNHYKDGRSTVKPHRHRCRQVCVSIGAGRDLLIGGHIDKQGAHVGGDRIHLGYGDALFLKGELHSVPPSPSSTGSRVSFCMFYGTRDEYANQSMVVYGDPKVCWFVHPKDVEAVGVVEWQNIAANAL